MLHICSNTCYQTAIIRAYPIRPSVRPERTNRIRWPECTGSYLATPKIYRARFLIPAFSIPTSRRSSPFVARVMAYCEQALPWSA